MAHTDGPRLYRRTAAGKMLLWMLLTLVLVAAAVGGTLFLTGSLDRILAGAGPAANAAEPVQEVKSPAHYLPLDPPFVVNFKDDDDALRYLQINVSVMARNKEATQAVLNNSPRIRDRLITLMGQQTMADLNSAEGKEKLRDATLAEIQSVLEDEGRPPIEAVYFTGFIIQ